MESIPNEVKLDIEKLKQGDEAALKEFFDYVVPRLRRFARRQALVEPVDAEEVVDETIFRVFKKMDSIAEVENPLGYCFLVLKNVIREHNRRVINRHKLEQPLDNILKQEDTDDVIKGQPEQVVGLSPFDAASDFESASELSLSLKKALAELPVTHRQLLQMRMSGYSYDDIATRLGLTVSNVRVKYYRIVRALKHSFDTYSGK